MPIEYDDPILDENVDVLPDEPEVEPPPLYQIVLLNDDFTPQEFVVSALMKFFKMNFETAYVLMWQVHTTGSAIIGIYPREIAESLCDQLNEYSRSNEHPLLSYVEKCE